MKNIFAFATLFTLVASSVGAQNMQDTDNRKKMQFEVKAGLNYSNVYNSNGENFNADAKFGVAGGAAIKIPIGTYLGIDIGALFSQKGFKASGALLGSPYSMRRTTDYIDVPLLFVLKPSEFITILAGPQYSYLLKQSDVFTSSEISYVQEQVFKQDNIRKTTFGFTGGVDINLKHIVLGARVNYDVLYNNGSGSSSTPKYKNMWFQGTVGYALYKQD